MIHHQTFRKREEVKQALFEHIKVLFLKDRLR
ncbi:MAG: hypothetical protein HOO87_14355 [Methyloglobulus sp.]|nr:hypothetical protein [Methyloglobulus sp.]